MARHFLSAALAGATGLLTLAAATGVTGSLTAAVVIAAVASALAAWWSERRGRPVLDLSACPRWLTVVCGIAAVLALAQLGRLTVFMIDPSRTAFSFAPTSEWELQHSCLSAYHVAAEASTGPTGIYDDSLYSLPDDDPTGPRKARMLGAFKIDVFEYPPPFLLLPRLLHVVTPEFLDLRMVWFALCGGLLLAGLVAVADRLGPREGTMALLLAPFVWLAPPTMSTLQKGNVQVIIIVLAMLAMLLFEKRRDAAGGALLAVATASKIYPVLLVAYLLTRRRWRSVAWTAAWGIALCALTLATFGWGPYAAFLDHLPRLMSGESFPAFRNPGAMAINLSIPGLLFKAKSFGAPATFDHMRMAGTFYMIVALAATLLAALEARRDDDQPLVWMAILILGTLRSPFLPSAYGTLPPLWLLTLLLARRASGRGAFAAGAAAWVPLAFIWPMDWPRDLKWLAAASLVQIALIVTLVVMTIRGATRPATPDASVRSGPGMAGSSSG